MNRTLLVVLCCLAILLYVRSPIDLLPDTIGPLGLVDDLVIALAIVWWMRRQLRVRAAPRPTARQRARGTAGFAGAGAGARGEAFTGATPPGGDPGAPWDPYAVLGVARGASADEIGRAYRTQMKLYHPDRVADLGPELQEVAHRKSLEIRRAYEEIGGG
jgi:DnaJ-domain-containing protein 1